MVRMGVVGLGSMGQHHARLYSQLDDCTLVGVSDINAERAAEIGRRYGVPYYSDYHELLDKVEAVSIAVPTIFHNTVAKDFLNLPVHCLVEKPIAFTAHEAEDMINTAERNHVNLAVGLIERFNPAVMKLRQLIDSGLIGNILTISTRRVCPYPARILDVGVVLDTAIHDIGVVTYLVGRRPISVFSRVGSEGYLKEDRAIIVLDFGNIVACLEVNWFSPKKIRTLVATGTKGVAYLDYIEQSLLLQTSNRNDVIKVDKEEPLKVELKDFLSSIKEGRKPSVDGLEGLEVLKISLESIRNTFCPLSEVVQSTSH